MQTIHQREAKNQKEVQDSLNQLRKELNKEVNKTLLVWGGFGAICAFALWWWL